MTGMNDCISRADAIRWVKTECNPYGKPTLEFESGKKVIKHLENMPSAQSERKIGHWERHNTYHGDDTSGFLDSDWRCSECGGQAIINNWFMYDLTDFCPNCGAKMEKPKE